MKYSRQSITDQFGNRVAAVSIFRSEGSITVTFCFWAAGTGLGTDFGRGVSFILKLTTIPTQPPVNQPVK